MWIQSETDTKADRVRKVLNGKRVRKTKGKREVEMRESDRQRVKKK